MFKFLRKHRTLLMTSLAVIAIALPFFGIGGSSLMPSSQDTIVKVNGEKIRQVSFDRLYNQMLRQKQDQTPENRQQLNQDVLNELIRQEVMYQEAKKYGLTVTDQELQLHLASIPAFQKEGRFDPSTYVRTVVQVFGTTTRNFEEDRKKDMAAFKLNQLISSSVHITDDVLQEALAERLANEKDKDKLKELRENPESLRNELAAEEANLVFRDWLNQLNSTLKVSIVSESFRKRMSGAAQ